MAEVFGVVASGVGVASFALQLTESIRKLKDFVDAVRDAPEDIKFTIYELETLGLQLADVEKDIQRNQSTTTNNVALQRCLDHCRKGTMTLDLIVKALDKEMSTKKKRSSVKVWFKKDTLEKHARNLERAKSSLMLSYMIYSKDVQTRLIIDIRQAMVPTPVSITTTPSAPPLALAPVQSKSKSLARRSRDKKYRIRIPVWLISREWHINLNRAPSGWDMCFRTYDVLSYDSLIFQYCDNGDLEGVKRLFEAGQATPFCRGEDGWTPLHWAASLCAEDVKKGLPLCKLLLDEGAETSVVTDHNNLPVQILCLWSIAGSRGPGDDDMLLDVYRDMLGAIEPDLSLRTYEGLYSMPLFRPDAFSMLSEQMWPPIQDRPFDERLTAALHIIYNVGVDSFSVDTFESILCCHLLDDAVLDSAFALDLQLGFLAGVMHEYGKVRALLYINGCDPALRSKGDYWSSILRVAIERGVFLHDVDYRYNTFKRTPMLSFISGWLLASVAFVEPVESPSETNIAGCRENIEKATEAWFSDVLELGVEVETFVSNEIEAQKESGYLMLTEWMSQRTWSNVASFVNWAVGIRGIEKSESGRWRLVLDWPPCRWLRARDRDDKQLMSRAPPGAWDSDWDSDNESDEHEAASDDDRSIYEISSDESIGEQDDTEGLGDEDSDSEIPEHSEE